jgi:hypothetical protein
MQRPSQGDRLFFASLHKPTVLGFFRLFDVLHRRDVLLFLLASKFFVLLLLLIKLFLTLFVFVVYFDQGGILFSGI